MSKPRLKINGYIYVVAGLLGILFVLSFDIMMGKPVNDISGPKSISALVLCCIFVIAGILSLRSKK